MFWHWSYISLYHPEASSNGNPDPVMLLAAVWWTPLLTKAPHLLSDIFLWFLILMGEICEILTPAKCWYNMQGAYRFASLTSLKK